MSKIPHEEAMDGFIKDLQKNLHKFDRRFYVTYEISKHSHDLDWRAEVRVKTELAGILIEKISWRFTSPSTTFNKLGRDYVGVVLTRLGLSEKDLNQIESWINEPKGPKKQLTKPLLEARLERIEIRLERLENGTHGNQSFDYIKTKVKVALDQIKLTGDLPI